MLKIAGDVLGDWADRAPGFGLLMMIFASSILWGVVAAIVLVWY